MDNLLWAVGGAAAVYVLFVVPLKRQLASASSGDAAPHEDVVGEMTRTKATKAGSSDGGCGCGG